MERDATGSGTIMYTKSHARCAPQLKRDKAKKNLSKSNARKLYNVAFAPSFIHRY